jgi:hypothetical protein
MFATLQKSRAPALVLPLLLAMVPGASAAMAQEGPPRMAVPDIAEHASAAVVRIEAIVANGPVEQGTGFFIGEGGRLITNLHVVGRAARLRVHLTDGRIIEDVYFLAADPEHDLVLLSIKTEGVPRLDLAPHSRMRVGEPLYALGHPLGMDITFSDGIVSGHPVLDGVRFVQITAPISRGSSGGPVVDVHARVVGVAAAFARAGQNVNLAVPTEYVAALLKQPGDARPFAEVAGHVQEVAREARYVAAALPEAARPQPAEEARESQRRALNELARSVRLLGGAGYQPDGGARIGYLEFGQRGGLEFDLQPGDYRIVAVCDNACLDINMVLLDPGEREVVRDFARDATPIVSFNVRSPQSYRLVISMMACTIDPCAFAAQLFRLESPPYAAADTLPFRRPHAGQSPTAPEDRHGPAR